MLGAGDRERGRVKLDYRALGLGIFVGGVGLQGQYA